jgi:SAM-dependent methyltransferase
MLSLRRALAVPAAYRLFSWVAGGDARDTYVREYVRPAPHARILDIGCGPADILEFLPAGVTYVGFDDSAAYVAAAQRRFGGRGEFSCQRLTPELVARYAGFDLVLANGVLHHLDDREAQILFRIAHAALVPGGRLVTLDGCFVPGQSAIARLLLQRDRGRYVRDEAAYVRQARAVFPDVVAHVRHDLMRVPYTHIVMECRL